MLWENVSSPIGEKLSDRNVFLLLFVCFKQMHVAVGFVGRFCVKKKSSTIHVFKIASKQSLYPYLLRTGVKKFFF